MIECVNAILDMFGGMVDLLFSMVLPDIGTSLGAVILSIALVTIVARAVLLGVFVGAGRAINEEHDYAKEYWDNIERKSSNRVFKKWKEEHGK